MHIKMHSLYEVIIKNVCEVRLNSSNPVEDTRNFSGTHMKQLLKLSSKCEDHFFSSGVIIVGNCTNLKRSKAS